MPYFGTELYKFYMSQQCMQQLKHRSVVTIIHYNTCTYRLTAAEKEARLKEMMADAEWRDDQRAKNVARYEEEQRREDEEYTKNANKNDDFIA